MNDRTVEEQVSDNENKAVQRFLALQTSFKRFGMTIEFLAGRSGNYIIRSKEGREVLKFDSIGELEHAFNVMLAFGAATSVKIETMMSIAEGLVNAALARDKTKTARVSYVQGVCELMAECSSYHKATDVPLKERATNVAKHMGLENIY